jgi:ADP-ribosylglycohydrolase
MGLHDHVQQIVYGPRRAMETKATQTDRRDRVMGCLLGGAVADALGGPLEFRNSKDIIATFGARGLRDFAPLHGTVGALTDDSQLMLFAAEAMLRVRVMSHGYRTYYPPTIIRNALRRWLLTQRHIGPAPEHLDTARGWLLDIPELWVERQPDKITLLALKRRGLGTPEEAITESAGAGAISRCAPAAMFPIDDPFRLATEIAAITHGHPHGLVACGYHAVIISQLMHGTTIQVAVEAAISRGKYIAGQGEPMRLVRYAIERANQVRFAGIDPSWFELEQIGDGKLAHDALGLALYCALCHPEPTQESFEKAVVLATNHSGNSTTVGVLTGQILGTMHGMAVIPPRWLAQLELREVIVEMADDLAAEHKPGEEWKQRYPPL